jgi:cytochrome b subunit of formate dehydrogenase
MELNYGFSPHVCECNTILAWIILSFSGMMFLSLLFKMFLLPKSYWFLYVLDFLWILQNFFGFMFYELIIITRYLIPTCLFSAKWHELSGMV